MEVSINTLSEVLHEAEILVPNDELQPLFDAAYGKEREKLEIKGFRKGKAPLAIIRKLYGEAIEHKTLDDVANDFYRKAMDDREIHPIGQPSMIDMDYKRGKSFRFRIQYEIRPDIRIKGYKGINVQKPLHLVDDEEIESEILRLRKMNSTTEVVTAVTDEEHIVTADVQELDPAGTPLIGRKAKDMRFYLAEESLSKDIAGALRNAETGNRYRTRFDPKQGNSRPAMDVDLVVSKIEKVSLPEFDESFIEKITGTKKSVEEFRASMRTDLERYWADWSRRKVADAIGSEIVKAHDFPVPDSLVTSIMDSFVDDIRNRSGDQKLPKDFDEEKFRHDSRDLAVWQAKWMLLKERIAEEENLEVTDEEINEAASKEAARLGIPEDKVALFYRRSAGVRDRLLSTKIMDFLVSHATITETKAEGNS